VNNNTSLIWNIVLTIAVAVLFFLHFSGNKSESVAAGSDGVVAGRRTVYVQVDSLLTNYDFFKDTKKALENKHFQLENELNTKGRSKHKP
jgi:outer membrane protein